MSALKINFRLKEPRQIEPWGSELNWFALTDGLLWIDVGEQTIYEHNQAGMQYFGGCERYNDYQLSRFLEDFFFTFSHVGESIPEKLYDALDEIDEKMQKWKECHIDEEDEVFEQFYYGKYCEFLDWYQSRSFDSGHLIGGPYIGCFRCRDKIKIIWQSSFELEDGNSIWTAPKGSFEMPYNAFVSSVTDFFNSYSQAMDKQVEKAVAIEWEDIVLDKKGLVKENQERKSGFLKDISFLQHSSQKTDWEKIMALYTEMEQEIWTKKTGMFQCG